MHVVLLQSQQLLGLFSKKNGQKYVQGRLTMSVSFETVFEDVIHAANCTFRASQGHLVSCAGSGMPCMLLKQRCHRRA